MPRIVLHSVTRFGEISSLWQKFEHLAIFKGIFSNSPYYEFVQICRYAIGHFFIALKGLILKNNLAIRSHWIRVHCDQMARLFSIFGHLQQLKLAPKTYTFFQSRWKIYQSQNKPSNVCKIFLLFCQRGEILPNPLSLNSCETYIRLCLMSVSGRFHKKESILERTFECGQCDQMAKIFFNIWPLTPMKICPKTKNCQSKFNNFPNAKWRFQKLPKTFKIWPKWRFFTTSGHTDCGVATLIHFNRKDVHVKRTVPIVDLLLNEWMVTTKSWSVLM